MAIKATGTNSNIIKGAVETGKILLRFYIVFYMIMGIIFTLIGVVLIFKTQDKVIKENGIIVAPMVENSNQVLKKFIKKNNVLKSEKLSDVLFVPNLSGVKN